MTSIPSLTRRQALAAAALAPVMASAQDNPPAPSAAPARVTPFEIKPLPFDPARLKGLSERLLKSHWENNYAGAIKSASDHSQSAVMGTPLLVLDLYEHAYHIDFGAAAARYVDAFFVNVRWDEVQRRLESARRG